MSLDVKDPIYDLLRTMRRSAGIEPLKRLFWTELSYDRVNQPYPNNQWRNWPDTARDALTEPPTLFATHDDGNGRFDVIYCRLASDRLLITKERAVISWLIQEFPLALFIFSDEQQQHWHFVNVKYDRDDRARRLFRRITIGPNERIRVAFERIKLLDTNAMSKDMFGLSALAVQTAHDAAFDVEDITKTFFKEYKRIFQELQADLYAQTGDREWAHDYALQFLNRVMFLYFVQRKLWLVVDGEGDPEFLNTFWTAYQQQGGGGDTFFREWLSILFFEAFNNRFQAQKHRHLPENIRQTLAKAPYLNGGLFRENDLDTSHAFRITDDRFEKIYRFFESYNFTISEDTPLDQEVAVDPEMIGKVYESLVNVSDEADERSEAGIFYTPRTEIDLMCRLSLVDWLANHLGDKVKPQLYDAVFAFTEDEKTAADAQLRQQNLWPDVHRLLTSVQVVDPACGSGSFLIGMLMVLDDLLRRADDELGHRRSVDERRREIIGRNLYGVDVMDWAVHVAELRLWLQLVIETDIHPAKLQMDPLLPNLSFKIRNGDSLVQEIGGMNLAVRHGGMMQDSAIKGRINHLRGEKLKFYNNTSTYKTVEDLKQAELELFRDIISARCETIQQKIKDLDERPTQNSMFGDHVSDSNEKEQRKREQQLADYRQQLEQAQRAQAALQTVNNVPFVWDIAFVEVFEGEREGFDIVIGNPPYVRHEEIRDPYASPTHITTKSKTVYKDKLSRSVYSAWPETFNYNWTTGQAKWRLAASSDLYIYFYFHSLALLNRKGSFCFVTSNSWLDVGYGQDLQEFLLTRGRVRFIIDNEVKRSFEGADVNTVIALLSAAGDSPSHLTSSVNTTARFVMLTVPFEATLSSSIWRDIDRQTEKTFSEDAGYRIYPITQVTLLTNGTDPEKQKFVGDKWGGKYLRAPDIFLTLLDRGQGKLVKLAQTIRVETYLNTGGADGFFIVKASTRPTAKGFTRIVYQTGEEFELESEWVRPFIKSPSELSRIRVTPDDAQWLLVIPPVDVDNSTMMWEYIQFGEEQGWHLRSGSSKRTPWWKLPIQAVEPGVVIWNRLHHTKHLVGFNPDRVSYTNFYAMHSKKPKLAAAVLNSSLLAFFKEIMGKANFGGGALKTDGNDIKLIPCLNIDHITPEDESRILQAFDGLLGLDILPITEDIHRSERQELDRAIFDIIGLSQSERDDFYVALTDLVENRVNKSRSV